MGYLKLLKVNKQLKNELILFLLNNYRLKAMKYTLANFANLRI